MSTANTPYRPPSLNSASRSNNPLALSPAKVGMLGAMAFLITVTMTRFTIECIGSIGIVAYAASMDPSFDLADPQIPIGPMALMTIVMLATLGMLAIVFALFIRPAQQTLGARIGSLWVYPLAIIGGLTVGASTGNAGEWLQQVVPDWLQLGGMDMISEGLRSGPVVSRLLMVVAVSFAAPLFEELVFRGTLWGLLERALPGPVVLLITSLIFAAYHVDPIHVILVFPVGLLIGWVRLTSGSIYPAILLHFVNNTLAIVLVLTLSDDAAIPWYLALIATAITIIVAIAAVIGRYRPVSAEDV
ncbi:MAG: membrane protease YdiL (CAAX protease family) [Myxococcota bacterium]|jgi:membrane protease YdiL (CAAX protease family)